MNRCEFEATGAPDEYRCRRCGAIRSSANAPERVYRHCDAIDLGAPAARTADRGLGDTVARIVDKASFGHARPLANAVAHSLGYDDCGCDGRRDWLNRALPYREADRITAADPRSTLLLRMPHGLGDAVQLTVVLRHLRHYYPQWTIDVAVKIGAHTLFTVLCRRVYLLGEEPPATEYAVARTLAWDEPAECYADSPATKAERCLRHVFHLRPLEDLCRYEIQIGASARDRAKDYLASVCPNARPIESTPTDRERFPTVLFHYQGNSAAQQKTLDEELVARLVRRTLERGLVPVVLDWDRRQSLSELPGVHCPGAEHPLWLSTGTGDGETLAALIARSTAMLAIDSGPGHIAGATETPTLLVWRGHHPLNFYALASNVRHAVPVDHQSLLRGGTAEALAFFQERYEHRFYADLRRALPMMFDELLDRALDLAAGERGDLTADADLWVRRRHLAADRTIVRDVYLEDCYGVDQLPWQPGYVVDVGAHLGAFACRIERRLAAGGRIICIEADRRNLPALERNVGQFGTIIAAACNYAPLPIRFRSSIFDGTDNTGASSIDENGEIVPRVTLEEIVASHNLPWIDVLKLDCEGCELSILENSRSLDRVRLIVGEWHDRARFFQLVSERLPDWRLKILREGELGLFWLENPRFKNPCLEATRR